MVSFSEQQLDIIARNPLGEPLDRFRETLEHKDQSYSVLSNWDNEANDSDQDRQDVISKLLTTLMATQTAKHLLNSNGRKVAVDLAQLFSRVLEGDSHAKYHPLMKLVLEKASDIDIWNAVLSLINTALAPVTTPESILPTFDDSPIVYSSASQRDSEQTRELVEKRIFEEIRLCTFRDVEGFFEKYFEGKDWTRRALDTYEAAKGLHIDGAWTGFPDPPVQTGVLDWWFRFQHDFLSEERRGYYTSTKPTDLVGAEAQRQVDLFVRRKDGRLRDAAHEWKDIHVIGQLKASNHNKKALLLQMGRYVRDVFSHQPTRRYVHAFSICGREMEVWVFDRSGCYSPGAFNIDEEPRRFIQVIAGYTMMSDEEMGLDTFIERDTTESPTILIEQDEALDKDGKRLRLTAHPFTRQRAIVCRGTACFLTKPPESENWDYVTKFSWTSDQRKPEADLLRLARERGVRGIAELVGHHRITSINEMRSGLTFSKPYTFRTPIGTPQSHPQSKPIGVSELDQSITSSCVAKRLLGKRKSVDADWRLSKRSRSKSHLSSKGQKESTFEVEAAQGTSLAAADIGLYDNRIFRCLVVSPAGRAIYKYSTHLELLEALRDAIKAHRSLHLEGNILHRDISENNIIITDRISTG
ncbi:hypothetical protein CDD82_4907 [Ophiocordyceps australis]|uniref:non-specific serine/threonine protein kinase n=1 Tax=Ophiocordyceps australis TaxID=1399860 RepID=A0A2C5Z0E4_9HYPO|nr:hypothetical protein CDD82_4907 [Ophiocordyceps australis]